MSGALIPGVQARRERKEVKRGVWIGVGVFGDTLVSWVPAHDRVTDSLAETTDASKERY